MREDQLEIVEKLFPQGFLMVIPDPNDRRHLRMALTKPNENPYLVLILALIQAFIKESRERYGES